MSNKVFLILKNDIIPHRIIADILWYEIPNHAPFVELGDHVVMPNHIHGILILDKPVATGPVDATGSVFVGTGHALSLQRAPPHPPQPPVQSKPPQQPSPPPRDQSPINPGQNRFQNIGKNTVSSIIGSYKSAVTKHPNLNFEIMWYQLIG